jgi:hypothetical protein
VIWLNLKAFETRLSIMSENNRNSSTPYGLIVGVALGLLVGVVFKKMALGLLLGIGVAYLFYRSSKSDGESR